VRRRDPSSVRPASQPSLALLAARRPAPVGEHDLQLRERGLEVFEDLASGARPRSHIWIPAAPWNAQQLPATPCVRSLGSPRTALGGM
jgi:hypothetical protein